MDLIPSSFCLALAGVVVLASPARADFSSCIDSLRADAAEKGISQQTIKAAFSGLEPDPKVLEFQNLAARVQDAYLGLCRGPRGRRARKRRQGGDGARVPARSQMPSRPMGSADTCSLRSGGSILNFGAEMGERPLVRSLSTLAWPGKRAAYFKSELMAALTIIDRGDIPADRFAGSWAGAFGQTQFMPTSFLHLAVAGMDGRRDIVDWLMTRSPRPHIISPNRDGSRVCRGASRSGCRPAILALPGARTNSRCPSGRRRD